MSFKQLCGLAFTEVNVLFQCKELLDFLGVPYVVSSGEAEALCAKLDIDGVCISYLNVFEYTNLFWHSTKNYNLCTN